MSKNVLESSPNPTTFPDFVPEPSDISPGGFGGGGGKGGGEKSASTTSSGTTVSGELSTKNTYRRIVKIVAFLLGSLLITLIAWFSKKFEESFK